MATPIASLDFRTDPPQEAGAFRRLAGQRREG
jgi:hypothetical protein